MRAWHVLGVVGVLAWGTTAWAATVETEANYFEQGLLVLDEVDGPTSAGPVESMIGVNAGNARAQSTLDGTLRSLATLSQDGGDGGIGVFSSATQFDPGAEIEANSIAKWSDTITNNSTNPVDYRAGFRVTNPFLIVHDLTGGYVEAGSSDAALDEFVAELSLEILLDGVPLYDIEARLSGVGMSETFSGVIVNANPTGAALPNFSNAGDGNTGNLHLYAAPSYDVFVDIGVIAPGESFTLDYTMRTLATSPGIREVEGYFVEARFGDPINLEQGPFTPVTIQTRPVGVGAPEPSTFALAAMGLLSLGLRRRRDRKTA